MRNDRNHREEQLRAVLKQGDPLGDGSAPDGGELSNMRRRVVAASVPHSLPIRPRLLILATAAALIVALAAVAVWRLLPENGRQEATIASRGAADRATDDLAAEETAEEETAAYEPVVRQVQFTTSGGTRIVWILNPDLQI